MEVPDGRAPTTPRGNCPGPLHRLGGRRALTALLHRSTRRQGGLLRPRRADLRRAIEHLDHHQRRGRPDRRQAGGHPGDATRPRPGKQLPQHPRQRHRDRLSRMERPRCSIPDAAQRASVRDALLHPGSRRPHHRGGADHGLRRGLGACSLAIEYAARGACADSLHCLRRCRALSALLHRSTRRQGRLLRRVRIAD